MGTAASLRPQRRSAALLFCMAVCPATAWAAENPAEVLELPTIEVIGTTPLPGIGTPLKEVPGNVQVFTSQALGKQRHTDISEYLEQNPNSININSGQGNPFQQDVNFRGFTASPLLGTPQGLSVFQDGVRVNEPFGDVVNWDLIPQSAISSIQLVPGSNPVFGLNTLGGALAVYTKSGANYPGKSVQVYGGSFGRKAAEYELGGQFAGNMDYFLTGNFFDEDGWADHNPSRVKQFFGKLGYQTERSDLDVTLSAADNKLEGTQSLPLSFFDRVAQAYTFPDTNLNKVTFLNAKGSHFFTDNVLLGGDVYLRKYKNTNVSSNVNDDFDPVTSPNSAINDKSVIDQDGYGLGLQLTLLGEVGAKKNSFTVGFGADLGRANFTQEAQPADFTAARAAIATGAFALETNVDTKNDYYGIYLTDTLTLSDLWTLTLSGRYNKAKVKIINRGDPADDALNGSHSFTRFNPALGINFNPKPNYTAYATYNQGMRAPTPIELTCADPAAPCKLPNNFLADPPLKKVVSRTFELGARGKFGASSSWNAALYRTNLKDDIQFINDPAGGTVNAGFFQNVGDTRREGLELSYGTKFGALGISARYSYIKATFQSPFSFASEVNSSAVDTDADGQGDTVFVSTGDRIPGIPQNQIKLRLDYDFSAKLSLGGNVTYASSVYARGDENNSDANGKVSGYAVVNLDARYRVTKSFEIFGRVNNLFDKEYANFGVLGENFFTGPNRTFGPAVGIDEVPEQFRSLGAPRGIWVGLRYEFAPAASAQ